MTQLDKKTRGDVFDLYPNDSRASLLTAHHLQTLFPKSIYLILQNFTKEGSI